MSDKPQVSLQKLSQALKLTSRRVQQLISDGVIPKPQGSSKTFRYDLLESIWAYYGWKEAQAVERALRKSTPKSKTRDDIEQIELQTKQFRLDRERGLYILREEVAEELTKRISLLKRDFKVLENRLLKYPEAKEIVKKTHYAMMLSYSRKSGALKGVKSGKK
ncbi:MAG: hypothetical protein ACYDHW_07065 [Syntrophorhabdaceae bacterium]